MSNKNNKHSEQIKELKEESIEARIKNNCTQVALLKINPK